MVGLVFSFAVFSFAFQMEVREDRQGFQARAAYAMRAVEQGMLEALRASQLLNQAFVSFENVTREQFGIFATLLKEQFPYLASLAYLRRVRHADRPAYERARRNVFPDGHISDEHRGRRTVAPPRPSYQVVDYAVPAQAMGIDVSRQLAGDKALARAALTGTAAAGAIFALSQEPGHLGFRLLTPHFPGAPGLGTAPLSSGQAAGYTMVVIEADALFQGISSALTRAAASPIGMAVYEGDAAVPQALIYRSENTPELPPGSSAACWIACTAPGRARTFAWAGKRWHVDFTERATSFAVLHRGSLTLLLAGLGASIAAALFVQHQQGQARRMRDLVERRTAQLRSLNKILERDIEARKKLTDELERSRCQLRDVAEHNARVKENERKRIARDIHDDLGQSMLALRIDLALLGRDSASPDTRSGINKALAHIDTAMGAMRMIINELRPAVLDLGLEAALEWEAAKFYRRTGIEYQLEIQDTDLELSDEISTTMYRIVQESMTNIMRHAQATRVEIALWREKGWLYLTLSDNGVGMSEQCRRSTKSFGLIGIAERIYALGGAFDTDSKAGKGTTLTIAVPVAPLMAMEAV